MLSCMVWQIITLSNSRGKDGVKIKKGWQKANKLLLFSKEVSLGKLEMTERQNRTCFHHKFMSTLCKAALQLFRASNLIRPHMGCSSFVFGLDSIVNVFTKGDVTRNNSQGQFLVQHSICNIVANGCKIVPTLPRRVELKIVIANCLV